MGKSFQSTDGYFCYRECCKFVDAPATEGSVVGGSAVAAVRSLSSLQPSESSQAAERKTHDVSPVDDIHGRLAKKLKNRRMQDLQELFRDFEKTRLKGGAGYAKAPEHVTREQFRRVMDMLGLALTEREFALLCVAHAGAKDANDFDFIKFLMAIDGLGAFTGTRPGASKETAARNELVAATFAAMPKLGAAPELSKPGSIYFDTRGKVVPMRKLSRPSSAPAGKARTGTKCT